MKKLTLIVCVFMLTLMIVNAQTKRITGTVTSADDGLGMPGVSVVVKGTTVGASTDIEGKYLVEAKSSDRLIFSFVGMVTKEIAIGDKTVIDVVLEIESFGMDEVVVTALGITREKKSLGYAVQEVKGEELSTVKTDNFINSLSGKVSGVQVRRTNNMGGSTNIIIRGNTSLTGNNQALFVVDGVPISNQVTNSRGQEQAGTGYDFGNAASDINPEDIESISVLKGAAASALYGSRAANGVIMITTKKGTKGVMTTEPRGFGVTLNSGISFGSVDKKTFPKYQTQYGAGYSHWYEGPNEHWILEDYDGDGTLDFIPPIMDDGSFGAAFDPDLMVFQWNAFYPESPFFNKKTPWVNAKNGPIEFFETPLTSTNTISVENAMESGSYRLSYTNFDQDGLLPNSSLERNSFSMSGNYEVTDRLKMTGYANYVRTEGLGRNSTGYGGNLMGNFRQWWQTNVDLKQQKDAYFSTKRNISWNGEEVGSVKGIYWDNPYWQRYENYESDERNRFIGNFSATYKITDWLDVFGRISVDTYNELQEQRKAVGSKAEDFGIGEGQDGSINRIDVASGYTRRDITFNEFNYDLMFNFHKDISESFNLTGILGTNIRRTHFKSIFASTNAGLNIPYIYALQNSVGDLPLPKERDETVGVDGFFGNFSLGYNRYLFLEASLRVDHSSTLPSDNSTFSYPSISGNFIFSELLKEKYKWLAFGKVRLNYAEVGNSATFDQIMDTYDMATAYNGAITSVNNTKKNPDLKPERTKSIEAGLEVYFLNRRVGMDLAYYKTNSEDQILPVAVSESTGYFYKVINSGEIENKGVELALTGIPVKTKDFEWNIGVNWTRNVSEVLSLTEGLENLQLGNFQGGVTVNAMVGQSYGVLYGTDFVYHENGQKIVNQSNGHYEKSSTNDNVIGDPNPDWNAGITNRITYKNLSFSFLIDIQQGGDIFSLDMWYGTGTGLYAETAYINDLGNPVRNTLEEGGGFINKGVKEDGSLSTIRQAADDYHAWGWTRAPNKDFIYDASYVKLREVTLSYQLPKKFIRDTFIKDVTMSFVGSNLWIIHKNLPHADPESGLGAGNLQGYSTGSLPTTRNYAFNVKVRF